MPENFESELRKALDHAAFSVDVPEGLGERTLAMAREDAKLGLRGRIRTWRDTRRMKMPVAGSPLWLRGLAAAGSAAVLLVVGSVATQQFTGERTNVARKAEDGSLYSTRDQLSGPTNDALPANPNEDVDLETGDSDGENDESNFATTEEVSGDAVAGGDVGVVTSGNASRDASTPEIVRAAEVEVQVDDFEGAWDEANDVVTDNDGDVLSSQTEQIGTEEARGTLQVRVPKAKLDALIEDLRGLGVLALQRTSGNDISAKFASVEERIKERKDDEKEASDQLNQARTSAAAIELREELERVRDDIDELEEERQKYRDQVDYSNINVTLIETPGASNRGMLGDALATAGTVLLVGLAGVLIVVAIAIPVALLLGGVLLGTRFIRRRRTEN